MQFEKMWKNAFQKCEKMWKMYFFKQFWGFVLLCFAPGSHCFAIAKFNRSAICTVHFRSVWTAPLRFSTCRSWAGSKVTAAKLEPQKIKPEEEEIRVPPSQLDFQTFFHIFSAFFHIFSHFFRIFSHVFSHFFHIFFRIFFQVHFRNTCFSHFFEAHFQNAFCLHFFTFFSHFFTFLKCISFTFFKIAFLKHIFFTFFSHFFTFLINHCFQACSWKRPW